MIVVNRQCIECECKCLFFYNERIRMTENIEEAMLQSLELFQDAIDAKEGLEIVFYEENTDGDLFVVENSNLDKDAEGHQTTVDVSEIFAMVKNIKDAEAFANVITNDRKPVVCQGITRIVGYYSRTNNWNKSKIGELRDRKGANYALSGQAPIHAESRESAVNSLS